MTNPYSSVTVSNYNDAPPSDDGAQTETNRVKWSKIKDELSDPLKNALEAVDSAVNTAIGKIPGGAGISSQSAGYTISASDQGKIVRITSAGTVTTPDATVVGSPFVCFVVNVSTGTAVLDGSGSQTVDGQTSINLPSGSGVLINTDGSNWFTAGRGVAQNADSFVAPLPYYFYSSNLTLSNAVGDVLNDITISACAVRDVANSINMILDTAMTKRFDASWASGTGNGGFPTALTRANDTWYGVFLVNKSDGTIDAGFDTSLTAANLLADTGGTKYRRIGWVRTKASSTELRLFKNIGDYFSWDASYTNDDYNTTDVPTSQTSIVMKCPPSVLGHFRGEALKTSASAVNVYHGDQSNVTPDATTSLPQNDRDFFVNPNMDIISHELWRMTNSSSELEIVASGSLVAFAMRTIGWIDSRS